MTVQAPYTLPSAQNITRVVLENGVVVLVYENDSAQSIYLTGSLHAGSIYQTPAEWGLASMVATALMHGTQHRDFDTVHSHLEDIGADLGLSGGTHRVVFTGKALAEDLPVVIEVLADCLKHPTFPQEHFQRAQGERMTAINYFQHDTRWRAMRAFDERLYPPSHPYHYDTMGTMETVGALTQEHLRRFYERCYGPRDMKIVITGAVNAQEAVEIVRAHLGDWQNPNQPAVATLPDITPPGVTQRADTPLPGKSQADIVIGTLGPSRFAPDFQAAKLVNSVLGQFGMMGRIGEIVREREGLAYYAISHLEGGSGPGPWLIGAGVDPSNVDRTIDLCIREIRRLTTEPVSADDLADNQDYYTGHLPLQLESNQGVASTLHTMEIYALGLDYLLHYRDIIHSLTVDDLLAAAQHYLNPDALVISVAGAS